jgi:hypothetical protein
MLPLLQTLTASPQPRRALHELRGRLGLQQGKRFEGTRARIAWILEQMYDGKIAAASLLEISLILEVEIPHLLPWPSEGREKTPYDVLLWPFLCQRTCIDRFLSIPPERVVAIDFRDELVPKATIQDKVTGAIRRETVIPFDVTTPFFEKEKWRKLRDLAREKRHTFDRILDWMDAENPDISRLSWNELVIATDAWHKSLVQGNASFRTPVSPGVIIARWPDGTSIHRLLTPMQFQQEGTSMGHCVGGPRDYTTGQASGSSSYIQAARDGRAVFLSYRDAEGVPHATAEIAVRYHSHDPDEEESFPSYRLNQLQGPEDHPVTDPLVRARLSQVGEYLDVGLIDDSDELPPYVPDAFLEQTVDRAGPEGQEKEGDDWKGEPYGPDFEQVQGWLREAISAWWQMYYARMSLIGKHKDRDQLLDHFRNLSMRGVWNQGPTLDDIKEHFGISVDEDEDAEEGVEADDESVDREGYEAWVKEWNRLCDDLLGTDDNDEEQPLEPKWAEQRMDDDLQFEARELWEAVKHEVNNQLRYMTENLSIEEDNYRSRDGWWYNLSVSWASSGETSWVLHVDEDQAEGTQEYTVKDDNRDYLGSSERSAIDALLKAGVVRRESEVREEVARARSETASGVEWLLSRGAVLEPRPEDFVISATAEGAEIDRVTSKWLTRRTVSRDE